MTVTRRYLKHDDYDKVSYSDTHLGSYLTPDVITRLQTCAAQWKQMESCDRSIFLTLPDIWPGFTALLEAALVTESGRSCYVRHCLLERAGNEFATAPADDQLPHAFLVELLCEQDVFLARLIQGSDAGIHRTRFWRVTTLQGSEESRAASVVVLPLVLTSQPVQILAAIALAADWFGTPAYAGTTLPHAYLSVTVVRIGTRQ